MITEFLLIFIIGFIVFLVFIYIMKFILYAIDKFSIPLEIALAISFAFVFSLWAIGIKYIN